MVFNVLLLYYIVLQGDTQFSITMAYNDLECIIIVLYCIAGGYTLYSSVLLWRTVILNVLLLYYIVLQGDIQFSITMAYNDLECNVKREGDGVYTNQVFTLIHVRCRCTLYM